MHFERITWYKCQIVDAKKRPRKIEAAGMDGSYPNGVAVSIQSVKKVKIIYVIDQQIWTINVHETIIYL